MVTRDEIAWYAKRLARMSAPEVAHRIVEQAKRSFDRRRAWSWEAFASGSASPIGLPRLEPKAAAPQLLAVARREAAFAQAGEFRYLEQGWPKPAAAPWWRSNFWFVDPVSKGQWPGTETFAYEVSYRHAPDRGDVKFVWELNRLQFLQGWALSAANSKDPAAAAQVWDVVDGWMETNPPFQGVNWSSGIEAALRVVSLLVVIGALGLPDETARRKASAFLAAHAYWLERYPSLFSSANNHRVAELAGTFLARLCGGQAESPTVRAALEEEIQQQFHADGVGAEQAPTYAAFSLEWFCLVACAADSIGKPMSAAYRARIHAATEHLEWLMDEAGQIPAIGDNDEGRVLELGQGHEADYVPSVVRMARRWLGEPSLAFEPATPALRDLVLANAAGATGQAPTGQKTFPLGGYTVMRRPQARGDVVLVLDHAPLGFLSIAAHGHSDALAVWMHWGEEAILVDAGTYLYHSGGRWREQFRGVLAHNTLALADENQSRITGAFAWAQHANAQLVDESFSRLAAEHDGYQARFGLTHRRRVVMTDDGEIQIGDELRGRPTRPGCPWSVGYTLGPGFEVTLRGRTAQVRTVAGRRFSMTQELADGPEWELVEGLYSPRFNVRDTAPRLVLRGFCRGEGPVANTVLRLED